MIAVTGGGTGGHVFPNVAVIEALRRRGVRDILWIGDRRGPEKEWAEKIGVDFRPVMTGKLRRYVSLRNLVDAARVLIGIVQSFFVLLRARPSVLFSKGGFVSVPPALAARVLSIPVVTHESDIVPGLATRIIARGARRVLLTFPVREEGDERASPGRRGTLRTGNPLRAAVKDGNAERGRAYAGCAHDRALVTVIGGSLGASSLNRAVWEMVTRYDLPFCLLHQCGRGNLNGTLQGREGYLQREFIHEEMGDVLAATDLVVSRAGAGAVNEIAQLGKPSILVPLPRTKSRGEQIENARYLEKAGACILLPEEGLTGESLFETIRGLMASPEALRAMAERTGGLFLPDAGERIADVLLEIAGAWRDALFFTLWLIPGDSIFLIPTEKARRME
jgi:UDP-N-acetylglucosamine--N-acetylmuramyl-(pentapeptide) pyrophosphoryl-undecaprenol N-acetylglucosamine transferase